MPIVAEVLVASQLSDDEASQLVQEFALAGLSAELREVPPRRTIGEIAWLALLAVPLKPFLEQLGKDFATDAYRRLKTLVCRVFRRSSAQPQADGRRTVLLLQDSATGIQIVLEPDLPDDAYKQLLSFDLTFINRGPVHYDRHRRRWRSELDEAARGSMSE